MSPATTLSSRPSLHNLDTTLHRDSDSNNPDCLIRDGFVHDHAFYTLQGNLAEGLTDSEYERVRAIIMQNVASRRAARVMEHDFSGVPDPWDRYQLRVIHTFACEHLRYEALQKGDMDTWQCLAERLAHAAQRLLQQGGACWLYAQDQAAELSQQACEQIYTAYYPWDVPFDLWAATIVRNLCFQRHMRSHDLLDRASFVEEMLEFDETYEGALLASQSATQTYDLLDSVQYLSDADELIEAIEQMQSKQRRAVVLYTYYAELSDEEIAQVIGKSRNAVYTLRHRALDQLRTLLKPYPSRDL